MSLPANMPVPGQVLPPEGVTEVLVQAALANPIVALLLVAIIILGCFAIGCWTWVKVSELKIMSTVEGSRAVIERDKLRKELKENLAKSNRPKKKQGQR